MLSEDSTTKDLADIEETIIAWLESYDLPFKVSSLSQLSDGRVFLKMLEELPHFTLMRPTFEKAEWTLQDKIRNMKVLLESVRKHLQTKLLKDISGLPNISLAELCAGSKRQIIKFLEIVIGTLIGSEAKENFLIRIMSLPIHYKSVFMVLLKTAMGMIPDEERTSSSPNRARTLLQRIDEVEDQLHDTQTELAVTKSQLTQAEDTIKLLRQEIATVRAENNALVEENQQLKIPPETDRDTARMLEKNILQQRLESQKNGYEKRIRCLEMELSQADAKIQQLKEALKENKELKRNCDSASKRLANLEESIMLNFNALKQKDETIHVLREKHRKDQQRILLLEGQIDELHETSMANLNIRQSRDYEDSTQMPSTYRQRSNIGREMTEVVQNITAQNSRIISEMTREQLQKQQQYETIILKQREKIKLLEKELFTRQRGYDGKENDMYEINSTGKKPNLKIYQKNVADLARLSKGVNSSHRDQIQVLLGVLMELKVQNERLRQRIQNQTRQRQARQSMFMGRLNLMFPC